MKRFMHFAFWLLAFGMMGMQSCADHRLSHAEISAFGPYAEELDTALLRQYFAKTIAATGSADSPVDKAVQQCYRDTASQGFVPVWFTENGLMDDADALVAYLHTALPENGLDTAAFGLHDLESDIKAVHDLAFDSIGQNINEILARLDYNLSRAYVRYTVGQRYGFMQPEKIFNRLQQKPEGDWARLFDYEVRRPDYTEAVRQLFVGSRIDYLQASEPSNPTYQALQEAYKHTTDTLRRHKLAVNMERARWQLAQPNLAQPCVLVNLPAQELWAVGHDTILNMRICCGAYATKTPLLHSKISYMQVNPDWMVPQTIIKKELSLHAGDSAYFARHHYYLIERATSDTLNPGDVSAEQFQAGTIRIGQHGGRGNSLGRIVFRFPNNFSVYLHDTNSPGTFQQDRRTVSHGCIRVQKPFELARFLLPEADAWTLDRLRISMDLPPETERGRQLLREKTDAPRPLRLLNYLSVSPAVPVFILYYTAFPSPVDGVIQYYPDRYEYDDVVSKHSPVW
ncbi:MAG: L,D-transpeptidase family protein [Alloprevotella sp.]|nr:L,D-transpeptidase family protein [Alloprevotella sp.]